MAVVLINMYRYLYGAVNRANYVIENVNKMLATATPSSVAAPGNNYW